MEFFLYGTAWKENDTERCVRDALTAGFRGIDTANQRKHYFELGVGSALQKCFSEGRISRQDIFLQTKFTSIHGQDQRLPYNPNDSLTNQVKQSFSSSLEHLHTDYLDSYVLHGPTYTRGLTSSDWEIWNSMENIQQEGKIKYLGMSNVNLEQLQLLYQGAKIRPKFVQNRCFAHTGWDKEIRKFCKENGIVYQGFSLLTANLEILRQPQIRELAQKHDCTLAQLIFCFSKAVGMMPITGTTSPTHMREDLDSDKLRLSQEEISMIEDCV